MNVMICTCTESMTMVMGVNGGISWLVYYFLFDSNVNPLLIILYLLSLSPYLLFFSYLSFLLHQLTPGGKAMKSGIKEREYILAINSDDTEGMTHHQAQQKIRNTGQTLTLKLTRYVLL